MVRYFFHATDGFALVVDEAGRRIGCRDLEEAAGDTVREVTRRLGDLADLSDWVVAIYADDGEQVAVVPFAEVALAVQEAAAA